ncbi:hypothetical protein BH10ACI1_BH10ACI1_35910 [soil metagenome]
MLNKIYLLVLAVFFLAMCVLTYMSYSWLESISEPKNVIENYLYYLGIGRKFLFISTFVLLVIANFVLWKERISQFFWITLGYFVIFIFAQTFWLDSSFVKFQEQKLSSAEEFSISPLIGVFLIIAATVFIYFNQFFVNRFHDKMFAQAKPIKELSEKEQNLEETKE